MHFVQQCVQLQGNDVATVLDSGDRLGRTPLHYAASQKTGPYSFQVERSKIHIESHVSDLLFLWIFT